MTRNRRASGRSRSHATVLGLALLGFVQLPEARAEGPVSQSELIANWKTIDELDRQQRSYLVVLSRPDRPTFPTRREQIKVRADRWLYLAEWQEERAVFVNAPHYGFLLNSKTRTGGYQLRVFEQDMAGTRGKQFERATTSLRFARPLGTVIMGGEQRDARDSTAFELVQRTDFKIARITQVTPGLDRVEFSYSDATGWFLTDRSKYSVVVKSEIRYGKQTASTKPVVFELKQREVIWTGDSLRCQKIEDTIRDGTTSALIYHELAEFSEYSNEPIPDEEFTLSHYGLPEPPGMEPKKRIPNYIWFLLGAVVFGLLAVGLRFVARRRERGAKA